MYASVVLPTGSCAGFDGSAGGVFIYEVNQTHAIVEGLSAEVAELEQRRADVDVILGLSVDPTLRAKYEATQADINS